MSAKGSVTKSDYIPWEKMLQASKDLLDDGKPVFSLFLLAGCCLGLRISDLRRVTWGDLLYKENVLRIEEKKTGKKRALRINPVLSKHAHLCWEACGMPDPESPAFSGRYGAYSVQYLNRVLKKIQAGYDLGPCEHCSTHSLRKSFGRHVVENAEHPEMALIKLSEAFNHSNVKITKIYLGITEEEILSLYDNLFS